MRVAFVVNGTPQSAMGHRARAFDALLGGSYDLRVFYREGRRARAAVRFLNALTQFRPAISYVFDMSYAGVAAASLFKLLAANRLVIDTGDAIGELARALDRGPVGLA